MASPELSKAACRAVYRAMLRQVAPAVTFSSHATKNLRRLYRCHFEQHPPSSNVLTADLATEARLHTVERTMLLLLSSSKSAQTSPSAPDVPRAPSSQHESPAPHASSHSPSHDSAAPPQQVEKLAEQRSLNRTGRMLSHRLTQSLASLTYHHLSPHVVMQRPTRRTVQGGSHSSSARRSRAKEDAGAPLPSLEVLPRPRRGPMQAGQSRKSLNPLPAESIEELVEVMYRAKSRMDELTEQEGANAKAVEQAKRDYVERRGQVKSARHAWSAALEARRREDAPRRLLGSLVERAEKSSGLWLGGPRWAKWRHNEMLL